MISRRDIFRRISVTTTAVTKRLKSFATGSRLLAAMIVLAAGLSSCARQTSISKTLTDVESFINEWPDSALTVLQEIAPENIHGKEPNARYALMMTMAKLKNNIVETDDSLIKVAVDYYTRIRDERNVRYKFLSLYHWGKVLTNAGSYPQAMIEYSEAEKLIDRLDDDYLTGLLYVAMGNIYRMNCDYPKATELFRSAYEHYEKAGKTFHAAYCLFDIGMSYWNDLNYSKGEEFIKLAQMQAIELNYDYLRSLCLENLVIMYSQRNEYDKEESVINSLRNSYGFGGVSSKCLNSIANLFIVKNEPDSAKFYSDMAWGKARTATDSIALFFQPVDVLKGLGKNAEALESLQKGYSIQSKVLRGLLSQPILTAKDDYLQAQSEINAFKLKKSRELVLILAIVAVLLISAVFLYHRWRISEKNQKLAGYIDLAESLRQAIDGRDAELSDIHGQKASLDNKLDEMSAQVASLFRSHYEIFDRLINIYYEETSFNGDKESIYKHIKAEINRFSEDKETIVKLETIINKYKSEVMDYIRTEIPQLSERDIKLLCYIYAGFSAKSMSVFTGESVPNVLMRKSRLRAKIKDLNPPHVRLMLDQMNVKYVSD